MIPAKGNDIKPQHRKIYFPLTWAGRNQSERFSEVSNLFYKHLGNPTSITKHNLFFAFVSNINACDLYMYFLQNRPSYNMLIQ